MIYITEYLEIEEPSHLLKVYILKNEKILYGSLNLKPEGLEANLLGRI